MKFFDLHCDTATECLYRFEGRDLSEGAYHLSLDKAAYIDSWAQMFAIFVPDELRGQAAVEYYEKARDYIYAQEKKFSDKIKICRTADDIKSAASEGRCAAIMSIESGAPFAGNLDRVDALYNDGVRLCTLTWHGTNELGDGNKVKNAGGLTEFGMETVRRMNELGMIVDVSHLSDAGFWDVADNAFRPFVASHSNSRVCCPHSRNLTDDMFSTIVEFGGLVGLNFCPDFLNQEREKADMTDIIRHTDRFLSLGGENTVCMGSDFDGTDMPIGISGIESMGKLYELFLKHNYSEEQVRKIFWENAENFFSRVL